MSDKTASSIKAEKAARQALELKQEGAELSPARPYDLTYAHLRLGIDVGSTTVKLAVLNDDNQIVYAKYQRHPAGTASRAAATMRSLMPSTSLLIVSPLSCWTRRAQRR